MEMMKVEYAAAQIPELEKMCASRPSSVLFADLGTCYFTVGRTEEALPLLEMAYKKNPHPGIALNLSLVYKDLGRYEESFRASQAAYFGAPEDDYARLGYAEALLRHGLWSQGWKFYDNARHTEQSSAMDLSLPFSIREWQGEDLKPSDQLLLINEGGAGDRFNYCRWTRELDRRGINWIYFTYPQLRGFYERAYGPEHLVKDGDDINPTHWTTPFSLPAKLNASPTKIPAPIQFTADPSKIEKYKINRPDDLPVIGLCWSANEAFQGGRKFRSLTEGEAMRIICMTGDKIHWVNLNYGVFSGRNGETVGTGTLPYPAINIMQENWEDTAGILANLDAVVSVDTGVFWLAGNMGLPTVCLLPGAVDWKFGINTSKCYWYPDNVRLYRNKGRGFENAISNLITDLRTDISSAFTLPTT